MKRSKKAAEPEIQDSLVPQLEAEEAALEQMLKLAREKAAKDLEEAEARAETRRLEAASTIQAEINRMREERRAAIKAEIEAEAAAEARKLEGMVKASGERLDKALGYLLNQVAQEDR